MSLNLSIVFKSDFIPKEVNGLDNKS